MEGNGTEGEHDMKESIVIFIDQDTLLEDERGSTG